MIIHTKKHKKLKQNVNNKLDTTKYFNSLRKLSLLYKDVNFNLSNNSYYKHHKHNQHKKVLYINSWVKLNNNKIIHRNFGDDLNYYFLSQIIDTNKQIKFYNKNNKENYLTIGSIISDTLVDNKTIIWGSGIISENRSFTKKPSKILAVRGPKTRNVLLQHNIDCPEVYGDPALLLPYYYYPYVQKKYKIGIIPHWTHINDESLNKFKNNDNIIIINFNNYDNWQSVIKQMLNCKFIVSESLHGLIISDAYKIPNYYVSFGELKQDFKYEDYFLSIGKTPYKPYQITNNTTINDLLNLQNSVDNTFNINLWKLINVCPFKLKNLNMHNKVKKYTNKVLLCCIAKMENNYIREFVEYYKRIGFDNICLYDNNDINGEHFENVIGDYIKSGFVIIKNIRGKKMAQIPSYTECYNEYKDQYDWIAFFDIDEFLYIDNNLSIKQFLSKDMYNDRGINCIRVCWKQYDDSGIIKTNGNYSVTKFKSYLPLDRKDSVQTKIIIKTVLDNIKFTSTHGVLHDKRVKCVDTAGNLTENAINIMKPTWSNACLKHYRFKTIEEYVLNKMVRLWPTTYKNGGKDGLTLDMFFRFNQRTQEKENYAKQLLTKKL